MKPKHLLPSWMLLLALAMLPSPLLGQEEDQTPTPAPSLEQARNVFQDALERLWIPNHRLTDGPQVHAAFRDAVADARRCVVQVRCDGKPVALGGVVGPDGWVLTKATQLDGDPVVRFDGGKEYPAQVTGVDRRYDLAMLKIDATGLEALALDTAPDSRDGDWLATVGTGKNPVAVGVLSVSPREIPHRAGILGVQLEEARDGATVAKVFPDTGAEDAGILVNDVLLRVNDKPMKNRSQLIREVQSHSPGDEIVLLVRRGQEELSIKAMLSGRIAAMGPNRSDYQNNLGSQLSQRRFGFPSALQHDTALPADKCGGPLVNLEGQVVGFNIARAGRTETYAAPTSVLRALVFDLMSGRLAPPGGEPEADAK
ncbi:putative periplasmic serine endoprotease DegP-like precursor [Posidoniimonas polymericola]|uniref:Putative periplasmic serine endoprotease DegP-like n=1 Tax=Posidoniimonas polymericola TaxID=2528002 RepID=A0A5C5YE16_9BACT|nr:trypsin-like peptidase domain-containing protein [Posidoniimonas polymericola]TWT72701.1 putative periplasmic serine endoprotease DegP-like precursor [Posidoniimonas polymericola]